MSGKRVESLELQGSRFQLAQIGDRTKLLWPKFACVNASPVRQVNQFGKFLKCLSNWGLKLAETKYKAETKAEAEKESPLACIFVSVLYLASASA